MEEPINKFETTLGSFRNHENSGWISPSSGLKISLEFGSAPYQGQGRVMNSSQSPLWYNVIEIEILLPSAAIPISKYKCID